MSATRLATIALRQHRMRTHDAMFALLMVLVALLAIVTVVQ